MNAIDPREAASALSDIETITARVRRSRFYRMASTLIIFWGVVVACGYLATFALPRYAGIIWSTVYAAGIIGSVTLSVLGRTRNAATVFGGRAVAAMLIFIGFGVLATCVFGTFSGRALGAFWTIYFMVPYMILGLWIGTGLVVIGLCVTLLTLAGFLFVGAGFDLWMAAVNGGGLIIGGLWMRRS